MGLRRPPPPPMLGKLPNNSVFFATLANIIHWICVSEVSLLVLLSSGHKSSTILKNMKSLFLLFCKQQNFFLVSASKWWLNGKIKASYSAHLCSPLDGKAAHRCTIFLCIMINTEIQIWMTNIISAHLWLERLPTELQNVNSFTRSKTVKPNFIV